MKTIPPKLGMAFQWISTTQLRSHGRSEQKLPHVTAPVRPGPQRSRRCCLITGDAEQNFMGALQPWESAWLKNELGNTFAPCDIL